MAAGAGAAIATGTAGATGMMVGMGVVGMAAGMDITADPRSGKEAAARAARR